MHHVNITQFARHRRTTFHHDLGLESLNSWSAQIIGKWQSDMRECTVNSGLDTNEKCAHLLIAQIRSFIYRIIALNTQYLLYTVSY